MSAAVVAYVPVLHEGYRRFLDAHGRDLPLHLIGPSLHADQRPLAKDVRALPAEVVRDAIDALGICSSVTVLDLAGVEALAAAGTSLTLPAEDVSYAVVERWLPRNPVRYDPVFLRWDKTKTVQLLQPRPDRVVSETIALAALVGARELAAAAEAEADRSADWWRQVGAAIRFADGTLAATVNEHLPHPLAPYVVGDPRANFSKGVHLELSTAAHAEARLIADAARRGVATAGAVVYVTDFPCPPCAKLLAGAGVARVYYRSGYAVLDGEDVLRDAGVEIVRVKAPVRAQSPGST
ncbi:deaminase [Conexibacter sp. JD483]|uniref:deoxycytidylate deaminase n=1 Tax=unclassified Conexibacter TaxID=2627773 RepID=UPI0027234403|nr:MULTISPECIES: deaminase [unclassified Conexibacter]MDO8185549.1 deaminase [Conexibacter sp. CPCC 205706]MDO8197264.1 deaminase [Conexibacter sp. CPCC 205762]MDR9371545.1 deaminase [Conexibacter sp. JD483]